MKYPSLVVADGLTTRWNKMSHWKSWVVSKVHHSCSTTGFPCSLDRFSQHLLAMCHEPSQSNRFLNPMKS